jgi:hypothetical protein
VSPDVFLCPTGQLKARDRRDLRAAGIVVVEVDDPAACHFIRATVLVSSDDMLWAALTALNHTDAYGSSGSKQREQLAVRLLEVVDAQRQAQRDRQAGEP